MQAPLKLFSRGFGITLSVVCIGFVLWRMNVLIPQIREHADWSTVLGRLGLSTLVYSVGCLALALAWWFLLRTFASPDISLLPAAQGHLRAQLAKYLPGNVFHIAARHIHARADGSGHARLAYSAIAESMILVMVAAMLSASVPDEALPEILRTFAVWRWPLLALLVVGVVGGIHFLALRQTPRSDRRPRTSAAVGNLLGAVLCYFFFFVVATIAFQVTLGEHSQLLQVLIPVVAICWLGGFLVLGAPGGLGVREALFLGLLGPLVGDANAILGALIFRGATILGDVLMSLLGYWIGRNSG